MPARRMGCFMWRRLVRGVVSTRGDGGAEVEEEVDVDEGGVDDNAGDMVCGDGGLCGGIGRFWGLD